MVTSTNRLSEILAEMFLIVKNKFHSFPCVFDILPVRFKVMTIAVCFAFLQNSR